MTSGRALTPAQEQMWAGQQLLGDVPLYNMVLAFELFGEIDVERFRKSFDRLVATTDALRTRFVTTEEGTVRREVVEAEQGHLRLIRLEGGQRWEDVVQSVTETPIPTDGWLFRSGLVEVERGHWVWYLAQHHLITDGWGVRAVYDRMVELYRGAAERPFPQLEDRPIATRIHQPTSTAAERPPPSVYGRTPDVTGSTRVDRVDVRIDPEIVTGVDERIGDTTGPLVELRRFAIYATALAATLARVGSEDRFTVLMPVRNRRAQADRETPGMFIEIRGVDIEVDQIDSLSDLERQITAAAQQTLIAAAGTASPALHRSAPALLNVIGDSFTPFPGVEMRTHWFHSGHGDREQAVRLQIHDFDGDGSWLIQFELNRSVFDPRRERLFLRHFDAMLRALIVRPDESVADIPLLDPSELQELERFNQTEFVEVAPVIEAIGAAVRSHPRKTAVIEPETSVSYEALWRTSHDLAVGIQQRGASPVVGIHLARSADLLAVVLGTIRAGGTFVLIPTTTPPERLRLFESIARLDLVVSKTWHPDTIVSVTPDELRATGALQDRPEPVHAYVLFTSGSTGTPKGVGVTPANLSNYVSWAARTYADGPISMALFTSIGFDLTLTSMLVPLVTGGSVVTFPSDDRYTVLDVFADPRVDVVKLTPSHLRLVDDERLSATSAHSLILGGENLMQSSALRAHNVGLTVFNEYGPTEATVGCMVHRFDPNTDLGPAIPLGTPAANTQIEIRDRHGRRAPIGVVGELWIGGGGVARGYVGQPDLTAERFVDDDGGRWYRSGDLARWSEPGAIEFLGRVDDQVKIRGHRVELGEVEAALLDHPDVRTTAVTTRTDVEGSQQLVAYYVGTVDGNRLRKNLDRTLPSALIPSHLIQMDDLPLNENGKVDRHRLPDPSVLRSEGRAATGPVESELAAVWSQVLGATSIGSDVGFLEAGGDSILAIRLSSLARKRQLTVRPADLLLNATITDLAVHALTARDETPHRTSDSAPLTPIQRWLVGLGSEALKGWSQAVTLAVGTTDASDLIDAWNVVIRNTPILRTRLEGDRLTIGAPGDVLVGAFDEHVLGEMLEPRAGRMVAVGFEDEQMVVVIHHLVVDAVSWDPLLHRLAEALDASGSVQELGPEPRTFLHWANTLDQWGAEGRFDAQSARWRPYFERAPSTGAPARFLDMRFEDLGRKLEAQRGVAAPQEILASALAQAVGGNSVVLDIESHGRPPGEDLDHSIGWFTALAPVLIETDADPVATLRNAKDSLRAVPDLGVGYGVLAVTHGARLGVGDAAFNYLGRIGTPVGSFEPIGPLRLVRPAGVGTTHPISLDAWIEDEALRVAWAFAETIEGTDVADRFGAALRSLVDGLDPTSALSPSDFPHAALDVDELSDLLTEFGAAE